MITLYTPEPTPIEIDALKPRLEAVGSTGKSPFFHGAVEALSEISKALLAAPDVRNVPQLVALGYWLRRSALVRMKQDFFNTVLSGRVMTARGLAFHLAPANVDTLFVYSWALSLLAGNANIVRLPSTMTSASERLLKIILDALNKTDEAERHIFCSYDHTSSANREISALSDLRMVWGGDAKVLSVSSDPVRPDGLSIGFPDRKSFAMICTSAYANSDIATRDQVAERLYNDMYWFDQLGCGSPRVLFWVGKPANLADDLYTRLTRIATAKGYEVETGIAINKFAYANDAAAAGMVRAAKRYNNTLTIIETAGHRDASRAVQGGGLLWQKTVETPVEVAAFVDRQTQTVTHFGFEEDNLQSLATALIGKGGYRLVPLGEALAFEPTWDGLDFMLHMTRQIVVRG